MFGFGKKAKLQRAIDASLAPVDAEDDLADHAPIEALPPELRPEAFRRVALALYRDDRFPAAQHSISRALALAPDALAINELAVMIASELRDYDAAISAQRRVMAARPREPHLAEALADILLEAERLDEVIALLEPLRALGDPEVDARYAEALHLLGRNDEAFEILDRVCREYEANLKRFPNGGGHNRSEQAHRLRDDVYAELHGREATIELAAADGRLDARAGANYKLLGAQLATQSERIAEVLQLEDPDTTERRGRELCARSEARGLVLVGSSQLRRGEVAAARKTFARACEADGRCFAAFLGLGAAMEHETHDLHRRARLLAIPEQQSPALDAVVPDLPALTDVERRVVWASVQPLMAVLPALAERGVTMRILPIDVRPTDLGLFEEIAGARHHDQRSYDALSGVATHGGAVAKIEELLDIAGANGWTFAHELAHIAFFHMPEAQQAPLAALYDDARAVGYANTHYALSDIDEFFAVSYADYLRTRHDPRHAPILDDAGIQGALVTYFDSLGEAPPRLRI
ncbi:MAG: hypothetical protein SFX73_32835 [Kofleriaceae bacterium]|nr:hypothetical protein [Kofleriaceae bacterium]